jgi:ferrochelatase
MDVVTPPDSTPYDGVLLLSFGGPERPDDVIPFLRRVTCGRGVAEERLLEVAEHYHHFGGRSPINEQNRALAARLADELSRRGSGIPVWLGNRNWHPFLLDTLRSAHAAGARRLVTVVTSAYASYSGCRQYREDLAAALAALAAEGADLAADRVRHYFNHPAFLESQADAVAAALDRLPEAIRERSRVIFVTHSIPVAMDAGSGPDGGAYQRQHQDACASVAALLSAAGRPVTWELAYCSRSGPAAEPWLEPDVDDRIERLAAEGVAGVVVVPIGFISDHMEVGFDLDTQARGVADRCDLPFVRAATVATDPQFVAGLADLVLERAASARGERPERPARGAFGAAVDACPPGCCPNPRGERPAACGAGPAEARVGA